MSSGPRRRPGTARCSLRLSSEVLAALLKEARRRREYPSATADRLLGEHLGAAVARPRGLQGSGAGEEGGPQWRWLRVRVQTDVMVALAQAAATRGIAIQEIVQERLTGRTSPERRSEEAPARGCQVRESTAVRPAPGRAEAGEELDTEFGPIEL